MLNYKKYYLAFTLVELVVIITILAILWTVGFLSYTWFMSLARDSNRLTQLEWIYNWLESYKSKWKLPLPDDSVTVYSSWVIVWYQWNVWETVLNKIWYQKWWKDPLDDKYYTYYTDKKQQNIELLWFLENDPTVSKETTSIMNSEKWIMNNYWILDLKEDNYLLSYWTTVKYPLNNVNLLKQSSRDSSTLLGMTSENEKIQENVIVSETKQSSNHSYNYKTMLSRSPHFVRDDKKMTKAYSIITKTYATDYTERIIATFWKKLWILLDTNNNPIQENIVFKTTWFDLVTATGAYKAVFSSANNLISSWVIIWTWAVLTQSSPTASCRRIIESWLWNTSWNYIINPNWINIQVYCDMTTDWWWWTRYVNIKWTYTYQNALDCYNWIYVNNLNFECFSPLYAFPYKLLVKSWWNSWVWTISSNWEPMNWTRPSWNKRTYFDWMNNWAYIRLWIDYNHDSSTWREFGWICSSWPQYMSYSNSWIWPTTWMMREANAKLGEIYFK